MQKSRFSLLLIAILALVVGISIPGTVHAMASQHAKLNVTCSGDSCIGQDPHAAGCDSDAYTVGSPVGIYEDSTLLGYVANRYSPTCGTNWALVYTSDGSTSYMGAEIIRSDGLDLCYPQDCRTYYSSFVYGDMVYDPDGSGMASSACGYIAGSYSEPGACTPYY